MKLFNSIEVRIYLGHDIPTGGVVSYADMKDFCKDYVDQVFPGYTMTSGEGVWNGMNESSTVLEVVTEVQYYPRVKAIAMAYKERFQQEAVLVTYKKLEGVALIW